MTDTNLPELLGTAIPFARHVGLVFTDTAPGRGVAHLDAHAEVANYLGTIHAGATFTLAEAASGAAVAGLVEPILMDCAPVTREATISYRRPADGRLVASATTVGDPGELYRQIVRDGRADVTVAVEVHDADHVLVAQAEIVWHVRYRPATSNAVAKDA